MHIKIIYYLIRFPRRNAFACDKINPALYVMRGLATKQSLLMAVAQ